MSSVGGPAAGADLAALRTQVTPENVLLLHNGLKAEAVHLGDEINMHLHAPVGEPGKDLVSPQAAKAFNCKIEALRRQLQNYVDVLNSMAEEMSATARNYGHTEKDISTSFANFYPTYEQRASISAPGDR